VSDLKSEMKERGKEIAQNEEQRHVVSAVRVSSWAVVTTLIAIAVVAMFVMLVIRH
jgi:CHASE3 domain sensor protein